MLYVRLLFLLFVCICYMVFICFGALVFFLFNTVSYISVITYISVLHSVLLLLFFTCICNIGICFSFSIYVQRVYAVYIMSFPCFISYLVFQVCYQSVNHNTIGRLSMFSMCLYVVYNVRISVFYIYMLYLCFYVMFICICLNFSLCSRYMIGYYVSLYISN